MAAGAWDRQQEMRGSWKQHLAPSKQGRELLLWNQLLIVALHNQVLTQETVQFSAKSVSWAKGHHYSICSSQRYKYLFGKDN